MIPEVVRTFLVSIQALVSLEVSFLVSDSRSVDHSGISLDRANSPLALSFWDYCISGFDSLESSRDFLTRRLGSVQSSGNLSQSLRFSLLSLVFFFSFATSFSSLLLSLISGNHVSVFCPELRYLSFSPESLETPGTIYSFPHYSTPPSSRILSLHTCPKWPSLSSLVRLFLSSPTLYRTPYRVPAGASSRDRQLTRLEYSTPRDEAATLTGPSWVL